MRDVRGLEISTRNARSLAAYERAVDELHRYSGNPSPRSTPPWQRTRASSSDTA